MNMNLEIERLVNFGIQKQLIYEQDRIYIRNLLMDLLKVDGIEETLYVTEKLETCTEILANIAKHAFEQGFIENNMTEIDLFTTKVMSILTPRPSEVIKVFFKLYQEDRKKATDYFYNLSKDCNYIMVDRVKQNLEWDKETKFGRYKITINVSKPEKTIEEIQKAKLMKSTAYPKCLLCAENVGFAGHLNHPARQNLRTIPLTLNNEKWQMQYSPYVYYNEHCIIFNEEHVPMKISKETFIRLLDFVDFLPHYFVGSNADLPVVGGSILSHDHFQGGNYELPMSLAKSKFEFTSDKFSDIKLSIVEWPMSVVRISGKNKDSLVELSDFILKTWRNYSAEVVDIISHSGDTPHNTITPIARVNKSGEYELDLVLRNNRTNEEYPDGIFHSHREKYNVKRENIGLIEVMGLGVLPKRLIEEVESLKPYLNGEAKDDLPTDNIHFDWLQELKAKYGTNNTNSDLVNIFNEEIGEKFASCLIDCGVFKFDEKGIEEFKKFVNQIGFNEK